MGLTFDWTVNVGNVITIAMALIAFIGTYFAMKYDILGLKEANVGMRGDIGELKDDIKTLNRTISDIAVLSLRLTRAEDDIRELRHGDGFINKTPNVS